MEIVEEKWEFDRTAAQKLDKHVLRNMDRKRAERLGRLSKPNGSGGGDAVDVEVQGVTDQDVPF